MALLEFVTYCITRKLDWNTCALDGALRVQSTQIRSTYEFDIRNRNSDFVECTLWTLRVGGVVREPTAGESDEKWPECSKAQPRVLASLLIRVASTYDDHPTTVS